MSTSDTGPYTPALAALIKTLRLRSGLTLQEVANDAGVTRSMLSHVEHGNRIPNSNLTARILSAVSATDEERSQALQLATDLKGYRRRNLLLKSWESQERFLRVQQQAKTIRGFSPSTIHGVLQTTPYATAIARYGGLHGGELHRWLLARLAQGALLAERADQEYHFLYTYGALGESVIPPVDMINQLEYMSAAIDYPNLKLGIIPWGKTPRDHIEMHAWTLYDDIACVVGTKEATAFFTEHEDIQVYLRHFQLLREHAKYGDGARTILRQAIDQYTVLASPA